MLNQTAKNVGFGLGSTLLLLALVILGCGDWTTFFSNPARTGVIILALTGAIAYGFSGSSGCGIGRREDPSSRWIFVPLIIIAIVFAWLPPHLDRLDRWPIDGDTVRYLGLINNAPAGDYCPSSTDDLSLGEAGLPSIKHHLSRRSAPAKAETSNMSSSSFTVLLPAFLGS